MHTVASCHQYQIDHIKEAASGKESNSLLVFWSHNGRGILYCHNRVFFFAAYMQVSTDFSVEYHKRYQYHDYDQLTISWVPT